MKSGFIDCQVAGFCDPEEHHKREVPRGHPDFAVSPSVLKEFGVCQKRWKDGYEPPRSDAKDFGNLVDCMVITPKLFAAKYWIRPATYPAPKHHAKVKKGEINEGDPLPWNANADYCSELEGELSAGKIVISNKHFNEATACALSIARDRRINEFIGASEKQIQVVGKWFDAPTGLSIPVRCLIDLVPRNDSEYHNWLGDLKTSVTANKYRWPRIVFERGYHVQAAFDLDMWNAATGDMRDTWCHCIAENFPPYQTGREILSQQFIELGRFDYQSLLGLYAKCVKENRWPDYDEASTETDGWSVCGPEPWMRPKLFDFPEQPESENVETETEGLIP